MKFTHLLCGTMLAIAVVSPVHADGATAPAPAKDVTHTETNASNPHEHWLGIKFRAGYGNQAYKVKTGRLTAAEAVGGSVEVFSPAVNRRNHAFVYTVGLSLNREVFQLFQRPVFLGFEAFWDPRQRTTRYARTVFNDVAGEERKVFASLKQQGSHGGRLKLGFQLLEKTTFSLGFGLDFDKLRLETTRLTENYLSTLQITHKKTLVHHVYALGCQHQLRNYLVGLDFEFTPKKSFRTVGVFNRLAAEREHLPTQIDSKRVSLLASIVFPII